MSDTRTARSLPWADFPATRLSVLKAFLDGRPRTRSDIAGVIGQSLPSAAGHIEALETLGLIVQASTGGPAAGAPTDGSGAGAPTAGPGAGAPAAGRAEQSSGAGRPPAAWRLNPRAAAAIGMELRPGGPRRAAARVATRIVLLDGSIASERELAVSWNDLRATRSLVWQEAIDIQKSSEAAGLPITSLGIALPGVVDCERKVLIHAPNLFLSNIGFGDLEDDLGMPVFVDNEANAAALAEHALVLTPALEQAGAGDESLVRISITEGVGAGVLVDGSLMRGVTWRAGEFGHMAIREGSRPCNCGRTGCWEQYASEWALLADARAAGVRARTVHGVVRQVAAGRPAAASVWQSYVHSLATGIENIAACIDPRTIVVGGEIASAGDLLVTPLRREVESISFLTSGIQVDVSQLGPWPASVGAGLLSFGQIFHSTKESAA